MVESTGDDAIWIEIRVPVKIAGACSSDVRVVAEPGADSPHSHLSPALGLGFSGRCIGHIASFAQSGSQGGSPCSLVRITTLAAAQGKSGSVFTSVASINSDAVRRNTIETSVASYSSFYVISKI